MREELDDKDKKRIARMKSISERFKGSIIIPPGPKTVIPNQMSRFARRFRDEQVWQLPILPGAAVVYQQLATGREWKVIGSPRGASRAVEYMQKAETRALNGMVYRGYEDFSKRRVLDWLFVGRTAMRPGDTLEYIDPTELTFVRASGRMNTVRDSERVWQYAPYLSLEGRSTLLRFDEIILNHPIPIGTNLYLAPIMPILPAAFLAWLVHEHDAASLDGRKIRDIIMVSNDSVVAALEEALETALALYAGVDVSKAGLPVVSLNTSMSGTAIKDHVYLLGISRIPESFDREKFTFDYVNQISAALGLTLRHFWNNEMTTNKALEEVQEQRQQLKGPASFIRSEQRMINQSGFLKRFGRNTRFAYIEEVDSGSMATNAKVLKDTADALAVIQKVFGGQLSLEAYLAWMQSIGQIPSDLELISAGGAGAETIENPDESPTPIDASTDVASPEPAQPNPGTTTTTTPASQSAAAAAKPPKTGKFLEIDYDEVAVNQDGIIIERRSKVFTVVKMLLGQKLKTEQPTEEMIYEQVLEEARKETLSRFKSLIEYEYETFETWSKTQNIYTETELSELEIVVRSGNIEQLTADNYAAMEFIFDCIEAVPDENS
jgi:hypothetical protein